MLQSDQTLIWPRSEKWRWKVSLFLGCMLIYATRTVLPLCVVAMGTELGWAKTDTGTALSAFFWGYAMTQVLGGYFSDRLGGDVVMVTAAVGWALITCITPWIVYWFPDKAVTLMVISVSRIFMGCFQGVHYPAVTSIVSKKISTEDKAFGYATITAGGHLGTVFSGSLGSVLLDWYGWHAPFYFMGTLSVLWLLYMKFSLIARERRRVQVIKDTNDLKPAPHDPVPWKLLLSTPEVWAPILGHLSAMFTYFILVSWLPTYFHDTFPNSKKWVYNVIPFSVRPVATVCGGLLADALIRKGYSTTSVRKAFECVALCGQAVLLLCIGHIKTFEVAVLCMALCLALGGFHNSGILLNPQDIAPKYAGSVFGIMNSAGAVPGFVGVYIVGYILETTNSWTVVFTTASCVCVLGFIVFALFGTARKIIT